MLWATMNIITTTLLKQPTLGAYLPDNFTLLDDSSEFYEGFTLLVALCGLTL